MTSNWLHALAFVLAATVPAAANTVDKAPDPSRLVAVGGSITEIVYALGEQDKLIARDSTGVYPAEALSLPDVGYMRALSPEGVLSVEPSAILALEGSGPAEALDVLKKASVPIVMIPEGFDHDGILAKIRAVGHAIGAEDKAAKLADEVDAQLRAAQALTADIPERKRVLFILSMQGGKLLASGTGTAADGIIRMAGAVNAVDAYTGYKQLTDEAVIEAQPDFVLMMDRGDGAGTATAELLAHPAIAATPAGKNGAVIRMDGAYLLGFGPRTAAAVRELAGDLYGDALAN
jgi:iron complex transport system substrate-binding protein